MTRRQRFVVVGTIGLAAVTTVAAAAIWGPAYPPERLRADAGTSLVVTDSQGTVLRVVAAPQGGRGRWVPLSEVPPLVVLATLAGEDRRFFQHAGVDGRALARAVVEAVRHGRVVSGGSTLTMQLARTLEPHPRSLLGKVREMVHALRLERALDKRGVLEQYLNRVSYGPGVIGIEAAAQKIFGKAASTLNPGEATLLAVLPRAPGRYDPQTEVGRARARTRQRHVLAAMETVGFIRADERSAIAAMPTTPIALVTPITSFASLANGGASTSISPSASNTTAAGAHFTDWVLARHAARQFDHTLEPIPDPRLLTTLDLPLQQQLEAALRRHFATEEHDRAPDAGLVVLDPATGAVRAMIGSPDHTAPDVGQINITTTARHPGSALKPFLYALAIEAGATPASIADDSLAAGPAHRRRRFVREHGPTRFREALGGSYNLAALDVLGDVGPGRLLERLRAAGLGPLPKTGADYGLGLALGAGRVRLVDLAAAYGAFVNGGVVTAPRGLAAEPLHTTRLFSPEVSWLVLDMLADAGARRAAFGGSLPFDLPFPVAAKTGTSAGFADTLAVAVTNEVIVAAWAGAFDGSGTRGRLAMWSAAPLVRIALLAVAERHGGRLSLPPPPPGLVQADVCTVTGRLPSPGCPHKREWFLRGTTPAQSCNGHGE